MSKTKLLLAGTGSLLALLGFGALFAYIVGGGGIAAARQLQIAMSLLDEGRWDVAGRIARDVESQIDKEQNSAWHFVQGVSKLQSVEGDLDSHKNRRVLLDATEHLKKSDELGFPTGSLGKGKYYLGRCFFYTYQWDAAVEQLADVDRLWPEKRSDALRMKVEAQLLKVPADLEAAQTTLATWEAIAGLSNSERDRIRLVKANLALRRKQPQQCEQLLAEVDPRSAEGIQARLWQARWRLEQATASSPTASAPTASAQQKQWLQEAKDITQNLKLAADTPVDVRRQATYLSARVLRAQGAFKEALSTFSAARQSSPQSSEAIVSAMEEAEMLAERGELAEANATLHYMLRNIDDLRLYNELWMPVTEFRRRLLDIGRNFRNAGEFPHALELASLIAIVFPRADSVRMQAETYEQWAETIASQPPGNSAESQQEMRQQIRDKHSDAAQQYETLAQLELRSSEYPDIVWRAITNYQLSDELVKANTLLVDYLRYEDRTKRPRGLLALGRNFVNAAQWTQALEPLERCCIEHPTHPTSFEARLLASKALVELDRLEDAAEMLEENLSGSATSLRPTSDIWRDSLYQLALTRFRQGEEQLLGLQLEKNPRGAKPAGNFAGPQPAAQLQTSYALFREVIDRLGGFVTRYPNDPRHFDAMYLVAKSHRLAAETPQQIAAANPNMVETARRNLMQQRRESLEQAYQGFRELHQQISRRQESLTLSEEDTSLIRNCYFGEADTLFELGRWEQAVAAYQNVASRFLNKPESLEALLQMAECYRKLGQDETAKRILAQAEQVLARIPTDYDSRFVSLTRTTRQGWSDLLGSLRKWD